MFEDEYEKEKVNKVIIVEAYMCDASIVLGGNMDYLRRPCLMKRVWI